ncbi:hypothetical protein C900_02874 [Fulvivirga imtechensis AK7]|uniref:Methyltransferase FkbM domain-containing protein n=1 Tax=Fulvivirga imtechensis AK7 TaxID=1237149 RepID=L8JUP1_9BACT|nr:FkbM family methyltransferase [Fulvivirga imtechensis]ELR71259.1 hypothetical protein C900_02874 [Fulvivirga imtechensis AK7]
MKEKIKVILSQNSLIFKILSFFYNLPRLLWKPRLIKDIDEKLSQFVRENMYFVQIGANDGVRSDPIHQYVTKYSWEGVLVEPVPYLFERLKNNYSGRIGLHFENVAITHERGSVSFYSVKQADDLDPWVHGLASLDKQHLLRYLPVQDKESYIIEEQVKTITMTDLLDKYSIKAIDLLCIDVEGFDYEVIKGVDFQRVKPRVIIYEHKVLSLEDFKSSVKLLKQNGYRLWSTSADTIGILKSEL